MNFTDVKLQNNISVVYLMWLPYGIKLYKNFIDSYLNFSSGHEHDLIFLFNGVKDENELHPYFEYAEITKIKYKYFSLEKGYDIDAYFFAAKNIRI